MKKEFCSVNYDKYSDVWFLNLKTALLNDYLEFNTNSKCINHAIKLSKKYKINLYIYDKDNDLVEKRSYIL